MMKAQNRPSASTTHDATHRTHPVVSTFSSRFRAANREIRATRPATSNAIQIRTPQRPMRRLPAASWAEPGTIADMASIVAPRRKTVD